MSLNRFAKQRDANEGEVVAALRAVVGAHVILLDQPVDLLVGYRGRNWLLEVKLPPGPRGGTSHSQPTDEQLGFFRTWPGQKQVVRSAGEALRAIGAPAYVMAPRNDDLGAGLAE